ncbi:caspase-2 [Plakobranchus ocellatus]|uniref:Caspase-2 n=1 Tax=Plakobranchus ocellatus TaxID=259542 RepID=A0AAV4CGN8_9GAST|nr:caspase-2 [Plakobranchus ocellatus]
MDPEQREILIARRVDLVEDINIEAGLFTQLLSRKILLKRTVNKIKPAMAAESGKFIRLEPGVDVSQFQDPQQYLSAAGLLGRSKVFNSGGSSRSPSLNQNDAVDTAFLSGPSKNLHLNLAKQALSTSTISDFQDSLDSGLLDVASENLSKFAVGAAISPSPLNFISNGSNIGMNDSVCDLDQIDLPDGCVNVKVEHCAKQFFCANHKKSYPMRRIPRGFALIINVDEVEGKPPRKGTNFDRDNLSNLLCQLHFHVIVYNDKDGLSAQEMVNKLKDFAKLREHADMDACFVCLLSHGEEGFIFGTDGKRIPLEEIFMLFGNTNCRGLIGKPKVFIIQACRGGMLAKMALKLYGILKNDNSDKSNYVDNFADCEDSDPQLDLH